MSLVTHLKKICRIMNVWGQSGINKSICTISRQSRSTPVAKPKWISSCITDNIVQHNYLLSSASANITAATDLLYAPVPLQLWTSNQQKFSVRNQPSTVEYKLPAVWYNNLSEKSILDPCTFYRAYELPSLRGIDIKDAPSTTAVPVPLTDPERAQDVVKVTLPYLMTIRHKKMKKHKRRKLKKRMRFLWRKLRARKMRKREKEMVKFEQNVVKEAEEYDVEKYIEDRLNLARKCGWGIDVVAEYAKKQCNQLPKSQ